jgi:hypothetical protein
LGQTPRHHKHGRADIECGHAAPLTHCRGSKPRYNARPTSHIQHPLVRLWLRVFQQYLRRWQKQRRDKLLLICFAKIYLGWLGVLVRVVLARN